MVLQTTWSGWGWAGGSYCRRAIKHQQITSTNYLLKMPQHIISFCRSCYDRWSISISIQGLAHVYFTNSKYPFGKMFLFKNEWLKQLASL